MRDIRIVRLSLLILLTSGFGAIPPVAQTPDGSWTFNNDGTSDYRLTAVSSTDLFAGALPADDPVLNLVIGQRYQVTVVNFSIHPFELIAKGLTSTDDVVLLSSEPGFDALYEDDPDVNWVEAGGGVSTFTLTLPLFNALNQNGNDPGYRCGVHSGTMRGDFLVSGAPPPGDFSWTFDNDGVLAYRLTLVSDPSLFGGTLPADDPTLNLELNERYEATVLNEEDHPLQIVAKGASPNDDIVLLSSRVGFPGLFDTDPEVAWVDDGEGTTTFTLTVALANALIQGELNPGYRSGIAPMSIRGDFNIEGEIPTLTPTNTPTLTATPTHTPAPPTATPSNTLPEPTATPTHTPEEAPTATPTPTPMDPASTPTSTTPSANFDGLNGVNALDLLIFIRQWKDSRVLP